MGSIKRLPLRQSHSGSFDWIGRNNGGLPKYLWDSKNNETRSATPDVLQQGYIAVSWTWGRYQSKKGAQKQTRHTHGTSWNVPVTAIYGHGELLRILKRNLQKIKSHRYFWVDVLCINQDDEVEKRIEIEKQANIFGNADGAIAFLWTLDDNRTLSCALKAFGNLLAWSLTFADIERDKVVGSGASQEACRRACERLRGDHWFTSLWALQEIVLFPSAIWMTRDGAMYRINGQILTTRLFAIAVRLLSWASQRRARLWIEAEQSYMKQHGLLARDVANLKEVHASEEQKRKKALNEAFQQHIDRYQTPLSPKSATTSSLASTTSSWSLLLPRLPTHQEVAQEDDQGIVVETLGSQGKAPWIISRHNDEEVLRSEIQQWTSWAFGTACIDISITASRAAILMAGTHRNVVEGQPREEALLAALKVQPLPEFLSRRYQDTLPPVKDSKRPQHLSPLLMNVILQREGPKLFEVSHTSAKPKTMKRDAYDFDISEWEEADNIVDYTHIVSEASSPPKSTSSKRAIESAFTIVEHRSDKLDQPERYQQRGLLKYAPVLKGNRLLLTNMLPYTASQLNSQIFHFAPVDTYAWEEWAGWHMHEAGALHIPEHARIQIIPERRRKKQTYVYVNFYPNGSTGDYYTINSQADLNIVLSTQKWLKALLGDKRFLFLPLGKRIGTVNNPARLPRFIYSSTTDSMIGEPDVIGVVLVAHQNVKKDDPLTFWYKLGNYDSLGATFENLGWRDGILVTSYDDEHSPDDKSPSFFDCARHTHLTAPHLTQLDEDPAAAYGFETIHHREVLEKFTLIRHGSHDGAAQGSTVASRRPSAV